MNETKLQKTGKGYSVATVGFVERMVYAEVPPRVEYRILERGRSFMTACQPMIEWAVEHLAEIVKHREEERESFTL